MEANQQTAAVGEKMESGKMGPPGQYYWFGVPYSRMAVRFLPVVQPPAGRRNKCGLVDLSYDTVLTLHRSELGIRGIRRSGTALIQLLYALCKGDVYRASRAHGQRHVRKTDNTPHFAHQTHPVRRHLTRTIALSCTFWQIV